MDIRENETKQPVYSKYIKLILAKETKLSQLQKPKHNHQAMTLDFYLLSRLKTKEKGADQHTTPNEKNKQSWKRNLAAISGQTSEEIASWVLVSYLTKLGRKQLFWFQIKQKCLGLCTATIIPIKSDCFWVIKRENC